MAVTQFNDNEFRLEIHVLVAIMASWQAHTDTLHSCKHHGIMSSWQGGRQSRPKKQDGSDLIYLPMAPSLAEPVSSYWLGRPSEENVAPPTHGRLVDLLNVDEHQPCTSASSSLALPYYSSLPSRGRHTNFDRKLTEQNWTNVSLFPHTNKATDILRFSRVYGHSVRTEPNRTERNEPRTTYQINALSRRVQYSTHTAAEL